MPSPVSFECRAFLGKRQYIMAKTAQIPLRVEPELKKQLEKFAKDDKRSLNTYCEIVFENHIALKKQKSDGKK